MSERADRPDASNGHLSPETLREIETYILRRLPDVLKQDPDFATWIEGLLAEKFPKRDEFARMLDELERNRRETREQFGQVNEQFGQVNEQFGQVNEQFNQVNEQFNQVNEQFNQVNEQFNQVNEQFDQVNEQFDQVNEQFSQVNERIDQTNERIDTLDRNIQRSFDRFGARWGIRNEMTFRATMRALLEESFGIKVEERHIAGEQYDVVISNGDHILIEIAASTKRNIVQRLQRKRERYSEEMGVVPARFLYVVGSIYSRRAEELRQAGFEVLEPEIDEDDQDVFPTD